MGMTIYKIEQWAKQNKFTIVADEWWDAAQDIINKYQQLQADYEARLKADLKAILVELQLEIEGLETIGNTWELAIKDDCKELIQQKINEVAVSSELEKNFGESDCISRKRAIERLKLNFPISQGADNSRDRHRYMQALADLQAIKELPPVTPQPRKGYWTCDRANVRCSCCGKGYKDFYGKARIASYNYCPNCGADMREVEE